MLGVKRSFIRRSASAFTRRRSFQRVARYLHASQWRNESTMGPPGSRQKSRDTPLHQKLADAWKNTPTKWYPLPLIVGALLLVAINFRKHYTQPSHSREPESEVQLDKDGNEVIKLKGPLHIHVIGALPLRNLSRLWGYLNSLELPVWARPIGFRLYATVFGCNLDEIEEQDLTKYKSLGAFFYRKLKPGARRIDNAILVSPADGTVLHYGKVEGMKVEQVKGLTYSLDALLGRHSRSGSSSPSSETVNFEKRDFAVVDDQDFANVNGIEYRLDQLLGSADAEEISDSEVESDAESDIVQEGSKMPMKLGKLTDASLPPSASGAALSHDESVARIVGPRVRTQPSHELFFTVIYLAPGDYHRFHSPAAWVVERRRHFTGDLFSVSPYMARRLRNLFVLNERVALLGRWTYGFFSMVPVGATNVGSILLNFDKDLRTNQRGRRQPPGTFTEAVYSNASVVLRGKPLRSGEEMGGFCLGSTIILVFEAPKDFTFDINAGQKVKVGQRLGDVKKAEKVD